MVELYLFAEYVQPAAILLLPEQITQHCDRVGISAADIGRRELPPHQRRNSHVSEKIPRVKTGVH